MYTSDTKSYTASLLQMVQGQPLHLHHLIVTRPVIEGVASFGEVIQDSDIVQYRDPGAVHPGDAQQIIYKQKSQISEFISDRMWKRQSLPVYSLLGLSITGSVGGSPHTPCLPKPVLR